MSRIEMQCLEIARNRRTCAGMDAASKRITELEAKLDDYENILGKHLLLPYKRFVKWQAKKAALQETGDE